MPASTTSKSQSVSCLCVPPNMCGISFLPSSMPRVCDVHQSDWKSKRFPHAKKSAFLALFPHLPFPDILNEVHPQLQQHPVQIPGPSRTRNFPVFASLPDESQETSQSTTLAHMSCGLHTELVQETTPTLAMRAEPDVRPRPRQECKRERRNHGTNNIQNTLLLIQVLQRHLIHDFFVEKLHPHTLHAQSHSLSSQQAVHCMCSEGR